MIKNLNKNQLRNISGGVGDNDFYCEFPDGKISVCVSNSDETVFTWILFDNMSSALKKFNGLGTSIPNLNLNAFQDSMRKRIEKSGANYCSLTWFEALLELKKVSI